MVWLMVALVLFIFQIITILLHEFRHPSKTVAWLVILFVFPIIGFIMYYFLAKEYTQHKKVRRKKLRYIPNPQYEGRRYAASQIHGEEIQHDNICSESRLYALLNNIPSSSFTQQNEVRVLTNADMAFTAMLEAMEKAKLYIHFEFYTFRNDTIGLKFEELLIRKAAEGVKIRCIFDGVGSYKLSKRYLGKLRDAGVETYIFLPPLIAFFDKRMNYRNHRKIVVVDGSVGYLGGINIGEEYLGGNPKLGFWRDTHLELNGDAVYSLQYTFLTDWFFVSGQRLTDPILFPEHYNTGSKRVQIISSGPDSNLDAILEMYFGAITTAKKRIYITTPYFVPDPSINMGLKTAAVSGVDVRVIYPERPDSKLVHYASLSYFEELMQAGVRFYSYKKGFIHAKVLIIDDILASVGTANMDMRSFFSNFELNAVLFDKETIGRLEADFLQDLKESEELKLEVFVKRSRAQKGKEAAARLLSPLF
ncbi:cardiolipin synthase [Paenibacillus radicis (ex Xue et al. 2023)]|uniref:Cardiolipin synthase n=1 Tax=Paenibacillus radicis (ex Xue et al. 2023) TaxID=2972489 RepID=A0ABT1YU29_9BACL|nr:cardiolipin synthase [Paenibacillus radicis (ex Xue et al. 2023)]MCR8636693.1 cardiolipin synthase [Paenibacillus radicis (ex Xue et al. 2023)]